MCQASVRRNRETVRGPVRIVRDCGVSASPEGAGVDPGGELLDPVAHGPEAQRPAGALAPAGREQQPRPGDGFQDPDGGGDLRDRHPGSVP